MNKTSDMPGARGRLASPTLAIALLAAAISTACGGGSGGGSAPTDAAPSSPAAPASTPASSPVAAEPVLELPPASTPVDLPGGSTAATPHLPASLQLPAGTDISKPGVTVKVTAATSSAVEGANTASLAIDGNATTRWSSAQDDAAWIQFDFGAKTALGYLSLTWENAYGKEYALQGSDDGQTWYQIRYVTGGRGGTEEFYNLNANVRYVRLQGVARATQYGYSLFEVTFKSPGSDNSLSTMSTTALAFPADGSALAPAAAVQPPLETVQFSLPDGTLVTRFGMMGRSRHGRERGEDWNEIGFGVNDTVDAAGNLRRPPCR